MKEGFIKLDGQDKPLKMFYEPKQKVNNIQRYSSVVMND